MREREREGDKDRQTDRHAYIQSDSRFADWLVTEWVSGLVGECVSGCVAVV